MIDCSYLNMTSFPTSLPIVNDTKLLINTDKVMMLLMIVMVMVMVMMMVIMRMMSV